MKEKILIIDDEPDSGVTHTSVLDQEGDAVLTAVNGLDDLDIERRRDGRGD